MEWKNMLPHEFNQTLEEGQIYILPVGSLERRGEHIPYDCDTGVAGKVAVEAARLTLAIIFPTYYFGQIHEAAMHRGAVNFPAEMPVTYLRMLLDQIAYNEFRKIMVINRHGRNRFWLRPLEKMLLDYERNYCLHIVDTDSILGEEEHQALNEIYGTKGGHVGETEASVCVAAMPDYVDLSRWIFGESIHRTGRVDRLKDIYTGYYFNAGWVEGVTGTSPLATEKEGRATLNVIIKAAARVVKTVQKGQEIPKLQQEILEKYGKMEGGRR